MTWKPAGARAHPSVSTELRPGPKALRLCKTAPVVWKRRAIRAASEGPHSLRGRRRCFQPGGEPRVCLWAPVQDEPRSHGFQAKTAAGLQQRALPKRTNDADVSCVLDQVLNPVRKGAAKNNRSARRHRCQKAANNDDDDGRGEDLKIRAFRQPSRNAHYGSKTRDANAGPGRRGEIATQRPSPCEGVPRTLRFAPLGLCDDIPWSQGGHDQGGDVPRAALLAEALHSPKLRGFTVTSRRIRRWPDAPIAKPPAGSLAAQRSRPLVVARGARRRGGGRRLFTLLRR